MKTKTLYIATRGPLEHHVLDTGRGCVYIVGFCRCEADNGGAYLREYCRRCYPASLLSLAVRVAASHPCCIPTVDEAREFSHLYPARRHA